MVGNDMENESLSTRFSDAGDLVDAPGENVASFDNIGIVKDDAEKSTRKEDPKNDSSPQRKNRKKSILDRYKSQSTEAEEAARLLVSRLKKMYKSTVLPVEKRYSLHSFCLPTNGEIRDAEFDSRPMVLLLGQYSTGKTSFIRHLLGGRDFPGMHIGPEPTTDKFLALVHGNENGITGNAVEDANIVPESVKDLMTHGKIVKGNTLTVTPELPFASLSQFGSAFLQNFEGSVSSAPLLHNLNLIDTPGVLSGEKQRLNREYDFAQVTRWFADRSDLILLLFDAHKLDISDELKEVVATIKPHNDDKIRCVLNKADSIDREELVRVYGSLMWSMGKLFNSPEVVRVYTGSYWDEPLVHDDYEEMFERDEWNLINELINLREVSVERKVNALVKRIRLVKVHMCLLGYIRHQMPRWYGKESARENVLKKLDQVFNVVQNKYNLSRGDMPSVDQFRKCLEAFEDFSIFPQLDRGAMGKLDKLIDVEIPAVVKGVGGVTDAVESASVDLSKAKTPSKSRNLFVDRSPSKARSISSTESSTVLTNDDMMLGKSRKLQSKITQKKDISPYFFIIGSIIVIIVGVVIGIFTSDIATTKAAVPEYVYPH